MIILLEKRTDVFDVLNVCFCSLIATHSDRVSVRGTIIVYYCVNNQCGVNLGSFICIFICIFNLSIDTNLKIWHAV